MKAFAIYRGEDTLDDGRRVGWFDFIDTPDPFWLAIGLVPDGTEPGDIIEINTRIVRRNPTACGRRN